MARQVKSNQNFQTGYDLGQIAKLSSLSRPKPNQEDDDLMDKIIPDLKGTGYGKSLKDITPKNGRSDYSTNYRDPRVSPPIAQEMATVEAPVDANFAPTEKYPLPEGMEALTNPISTLAASLGKFLSQKGSGNFQNILPENQESLENKSLESVYGRSLKDLESSSTNKAQTLQNVDSKKPMKQVDRRALDEAEAKEALLKNQDVLQQEQEFAPSTASPSDVSLDRSVSEGDAVSPQQAPLATEPSPEIGSPDTQVMSGSVDKVASSPESRYELTKLAGPEISDEMLQTAKAYEAALDERNQAINDEVKSIRDRIASERLSNQDLFFIGLAVLASSIAANASEPGSFAQTASAGLGALVNRLDASKKGERKGMERISALGQEKAKSEMERIKIQGDILKNIPGYSLKKMLAGRAAIAKDGKIFAVATRNPDLWVSPERLQNMDEKELKKFESETITKAGEAINTSSEIQKLTQEIIDVYGELNKQLDSNMLPNGFWQYVGTQNPRAVYSPIKVDGKVVDNPVAWTASNLNRLKSLYLKANRMGNGALTGNSLSHMEGIFPDVKDPGNVFKADIPTMISTLEKSKMTLADDTIGQLKADGFVPEMLEQKLYNVSSKSEISATGYGLDYSVKKALQDPNKLERAQAGEWVDL